MQRLIIIILALMVSLPIIMKSRVSQIKSTHAAFPVISTSKVIVKVSGDVKYPGIYEVNVNALASSVIKMAIADAPLNSLKPVDVSARRVENGTDLQVKMLEDGTGFISTGLIPAGERVVLGIPLDINSMSEADFKRLPGVGPVMARRITEYRHKNGGKMSGEELREVEGIGEVKYDKLKKYFKPAEYNE